VAELNREIYLVQNPAIGATILWQFVCGYYDQDCESRALFVVLPIIFREDLRTIIKSTQRSKGLQKVSEKLFAEKRADTFSSIHGYANQYKEITLSAVSIALTKRLISLSTETAMVIPIQSKIKIPDASKEILNLAKKLGEWCANMTMHEISALLKVRF
jgi:hypothetical protein